MAFEHRYERHVQFADTDMAGIAHFSVFFRYAEEAEHAFLRSLGLSVHTRGDGFALGFPRVSARCEYRQPARFEDVLETHIWVHRKGRTSIIYQFEIARGADPIAKGELAVICCRSYPDSRVEPVALPLPLAERLEEAPYPPLEFRR